MACANRRCREWRHQILPAAHHVQALPCCALLPPRPLPPRPLTFLGPALPPITLLPVPGSSGYISDSGTTTTTTTSISTGRLGGGGGGGAPSPSYPAGHIGVSDDEGGCLLEECVGRGCT